MLFYVSSRFTHTTNAAVFLGRNNVSVSARFFVVLLFLYVNFSFVATCNVFFTRQILAMHLTESNKIIFICSADLVLVFLATRVLHLLQFHIPSHGPIQKFTFKKITGTDTLKHC